MSCAYNAAMDHERLASASMGQEMRVVSAENSDLRSERSRLKSQLSRISSSLKSVNRKLSKEAPGSSSYAALLKEKQRLEKQKVECEGDIDALA